MGSADVLGSFCSGSLGDLEERNDKHFRGIQPSFESWRSRFKQDFAMLVHRSRQEQGPYILSIVNLL